MRWRTTIEQEARLAALLEARANRSLDIGEEAELNELAERKRDRDRQDRCRLPLKIEDTRKRLAEMLRRAAELDLRVPPENAHG